MGKQIRNILGTIEGMNGSIQDVGVVMDIEMPKLELPDEDYGAMVLGQGLDEDDGDW